MARQAGKFVDYVIIGGLTLLLMAVLLVFFRDQIAAVLAWITRLIG